MPAFVSSRTSDELRQRLRERRPEQQQRERRQRDELDDAQKAQQRHGLGDEHRGAVDRCEQEAVEAALLVLGDEQPVDAEDRGEQQRHDEHAGGEVAGDAVAVQAEVKDDVRRDAEEHHRGHGLARAPAPA